MKSILDPSFKYTKSVDTDLRKTFARIKRERRREEQALSTASTAAARKVLPLRSMKAV